MNDTTKQAQIVPTEHQDVSQGSSMLALIERAATNPDVDVEKLERLWQMKKEFDAKQAEMAYNAAFSKMQGDLPEITEGGAIRHSGKLISQYARWDEDINPVIKPILARHGFALSFRTDTKDHVVVEAVLAHSDGHSERTSMHLPTDTSGSKNNVQAVASSVSYGKRYTAGALLNLTTGGMDDDGNKAGAPELVSAEQVANIEALAQEVGADIKRFLGYLSNYTKTPLESVSEIPAKMYNEAIKALEAKRK